MRQATAADPAHGRTQPARPELGEARASLDGVHRLGLTRRQPQSPAGTRTAQPDQQHARHSSNQSSKLKSRCYAACECQAEKLVVQHTNSVPCSTAPCVLTRSRASAAAAPAEARLAEAESGARQVRVRQGATPAARGVGTAHGALEGQRGRRGPLARHTKRTARRAAARECVRGAYMRSRIRVWQSTS